MRASRWTRHGYDRVYVNTADGERVGWLDLLTGTSTIERDDLTQEFERAIACYPVSVRPQPEAASVTPPPCGSVPPLAEATRAPEPAWQDLAGNRPGQAVRQKANDLHGQMREKSRVRTFLLRATDAKTDERAYRVGAEGEEAVGPRLERLASRGWKVLHSVPIGNHDTDIDHVLIGPGGVYTINTKNHPGGRVWVAEHAIRVNGQQTDYLRKSRVEAVRANKMLLAATGLDLPVRGALVFLTGTMIPQVTIKARPSDVLILDKTDVPGTFKRSPRRLDDSVIEQVYAAARRSDTWS